MVEPEGDPDETLQALASGSSAAEGMANEIRLTTGFQRPHRDELHSWHIELGQRTFRAIQV